MRRSRNHTKGPWSVTNGDLLRVITGYGDRKVVAGVHRIGSRGGGTSGDPVANAHLIAAAPDMLEALDAALEALDPVDAAEVRSVVSAAIARAEGRRPSASVPEVRNPSQETRP